jgi:hypothetical protein
VEQAIILRAVGEKEYILDPIGNLDSEDVVKYITEIMEGGPEVFQYRRSIYQSYWSRPISGSGEQTILS